MSGDERDMGDDDANGTMKGFSDETTPMLMYLPSSRPPPRRVAHVTATRKPRAQWPACMMASMESSLSRVLVSPCCEKWATANSIREEDDALLQGIWEINPHQRCDLICDLLNMQRSLRDTNVEMGTIPVVRLDIDHI